MRKEKKASVEGLFVIVIILFMFGIASIIGVKMYDEFSQTQLVQNNTKANESFTGGVQQGINLTDNLVLFIIVTFFIMMLALASTIKASPAFFVITFIVFSIVLLLSVVISNSYVQFENSTAFTGMSVELDKTNHLMQYLPFYIGGFGFIILIVIYGRGAFGKVK